MGKKWIVVFALAGLLAWAAGAPDASSVVSNATKALGADNLKTIEFSGSGSDFVLGQAPAPNTP